MRDRRTLTGVILLVLLAAYALLAPAFAADGAAAMSYDRIRLAPSASHPFGTDGVGRDLWAVTAQGIRISLLVAAACAVASTVLGVLLGGLFGVFGGWVDRIGMRLVDGVNAMPHLMLGIVIVALYRGSPVAVVASIALTHWTSVARVVRAELLSLREREFVAAATLGGAGRWRIAHRHLLPAVMPQALASLVLILPHAVWHESALSFLGLGLPPHLPSLGTLLADSRSALLLGAWWQVAFPAAALVLTTLGVAGIGAGLRDRLNPRRRTEVTL